MAVNPIPAPPTQVPAGFGCWWESIEVQTSKAPDFVDLTERVERAVARSGISDGLAVIFSRHTTAAIVVNENEPLLLEDLSRFFERLAPRGARYRHNDFSVRTVNMTEDESPNGHAHCVHLTLGVSQTVPIQRGKLALGQWQRIFLVELDRARPREAVVQAIGVSGGPLGPTPVEIGRNGARTSRRV